MRSYQSVIILKPDLDETQVDQTLGSIEDIIKTQGGAFLKVEKWGKKRLAYKVRKNRFGYYLNLYHTCENANVATMEEKFRLFDPIIKYLVVRMEDQEIERVLAAKSVEATETEGGSDEATNSDESKSEESSQPDEG